MTMTIRSGVLREALKILADVLYNKSRSELLFRIHGSCASVVPICAQIISVNAPMNCGVAFTPNLSVSSSTILPIENQSAALSR